MLTVVDFAEVETHGRFACFRRKREGRLNFTMGLCIRGREPFSMLMFSLLGFLGHCTMALSCCDRGLIMQGFLSLIMRKMEIRVLQGVNKVLYTSSLTTHKNTPFTALYLRTFSLHLITISHPAPTPFQHLFSLLTHQNV
jgi:hypothetical protein